jgi:hypothetical protein
MLVGLMSSRSVGGTRQPTRKLSAQHSSDHELTSAQHSTAQGWRHALSVTRFSRSCHRLMRRSSAERNDSPSLFVEMEFTWYVCAFA